LVNLNEAQYLVMEDRRGNIIDAVNIEWGWKTKPLTFDPGTHGISEDEKVYKVILPILVNE